tara:strand:- start:555 stop:791 length:237 start_codon:yes stop_codon:yes gene_type:complete
VGVAGHNLRDSTSNINITGGRRQLIITDVFRMPVSKLAILIIAPTADSTRVEQSTGVVPTDRDLFDRAANINIASGNW